MNNSKFRDYILSVLSAAENNSTCRRMKVAAILVKDGRIISTGWNGVPSGFQHCCELQKLHEEQGVEHHDFSEREELHAEQNCIAFAARYGIPTDGTDLYITISPCSSCAKLIIASGVNSVYFKNIYDRSDAGLQLLTKANIHWEII